VVLFIRGVDAFFKIIEELGAIHSMQDICTGDEIFLKVKEIIFALGLDFKMLKDVTTYGERNISGTCKGLVENVCKAVLAT
jgi:hypothetical protein